MNRRFFKRAAAFVVASLMAGGIITVLPEECLPQIGTVVSAEETHITKIKMKKIEKVNDNIDVNVDCLIDTNNNFINDGWFTMWCNVNDYNNILPKDSVGLIYTYGCNYVDDNGNTGEWDFSGSSNFTPFNSGGSTLYLAVHSYDEYYFDLGYADRSVDNSERTFVSCIKVYFDPKHTYIEDFISDETGHWYACNGCNEKIDFAAHTEDNGTVIVEPTETTEGEKVYKCTACDYVTRTEPVAKLEHADGVAINEANFPDEIFRQYVSDNFDSDNNGLLSNDEISVITQISIRGTNDVRGNLKSLKGVEYFTELTELDCWHNQLTSLDVSKNTKLTDLSCSVNKLTSLDVSKNTVLKELDCAGNQITLLDVSQNTELNGLYCGDNQLTLLDVSQNTKLMNLYCHNNKFTSLDLSKNTKLFWLTCTGNQLTSLDLSKNNMLYGLRCEENQLTSLDVSNITTLAHFQCENNQFNIGKLYGEYDLKNLPSGFDVTKASNWQGATLKDDMLTEIDGTGTITYTYDCGNNHTATFSLRYNYVEPTVPSQPTDPTDPTEPSQPTNPTNPTNPTTPQQPTENESETIISAKNGWGNIVKQINAANDNSKINIDMGNTTNVPKNVMNAIQGKDIDIVLDMGDGITWTINGKDVTNPQSLDFSVTKKKNSIPQNLISDPDNTIPLVLAHNGNFGCSATLSIELGDNNSKKFANLYYYNTKTKELEFVDSDEIVNGKANLVFTHASDWAIVISDTSAEYEDVSSAAGIYEADDNLQSPLYMIMIIIIIAAVGFSSIIIVKRFAKNKH